MEPTSASNETYIHLIAFRNAYADRAAAAFRSLRRREARQSAQISEATTSSSAHIPNVGIRSRFENPNFRRIQIIEFPLYNIALVMDDFECGICLHAEEQEDEVV